jgi:hypothetical protein
MDLDDPTLSQAWVSGAHFLEHLPHFSKFPSNNKAWPSLTFLGQEPSELKPMCCLPLVSSSLTNHPSHLPAHGMGQVPQGAHRSSLGHSPRATWEAMASFTLVIRRHLNSSVHSTLHQSPPKTSHLCPQAIGVLEPCLLPPPVSW